MTAFKYGDRVSIYGSAYLKFAGSNQIDFLCGKHGTIIESPHAPEEYEVKADDTFLYTAHPKQLRRLKPKPKAESKPPREYYKSSIENPIDGTNFVMCRISTHRCAADDVHVIELPPASAVVSRESLAKAFGSVGIRMHLYQDAHDECFEVLCKALGLSPEGKGGKG